MLTSERFTTKENEPQEVNSLVQTPRNDDPVSENRLRKCLRNFETLEKSMQFTRVCEDASFFHRVSVGMCYKTVLDVDDCFGDRTPACREYAPSCGVGFQNICRHSTTNNTWTSSSSSCCAYISKILETTTRVRNYFGKIHCKIK